VARLMRGEKADLCLTDPPYGVGLEYNTFDDTKDAVKQLAEKWLPLARDNSKVVVFSSGIKQISIYPSPDWILCWFYKAGQFMSPWGFNCWQPFLCYGKDPSLAKQQGSRPDAVDMNTPANASELGHPCPKPLGLWEWMLNRLCFSENEIIYDPFLGSGTTLIAAEKTGRVCYGMEIDPKYCDVIIKRYADYVGISEEVIRATREAQ